MMKVDSGLKGAAAVVLMVAAFFLGSCVEASFWHDNSHLEMFGGVPTQIEGETVRFVSAPPSHPSGVPAGLRWQPDAISLGNVVIPLTADHDPDPKVNSAFWGYVNPEPDASVTVERVQREGEWDGRVYSGPPIARVGDAADIADIRKRLSDLEQHAWNPDSMCLGPGSDGMFRWVNCVIEPIPGKCLKWSVGTDQWRWVDCLTKPGESYLVMP